MGLKVSDLDNKEFIDSLEWHKPVIVSDWGYWTEAGGIPLNKCEGDEIYVKFADGTVVSRELHMEPRGVYSCVPFIVEKMHGHEFILYLNTASCEVAFQRDYREKERKPVNY
jgi:hypothetical protein